MARDFSKKREPMDYKERFEFVLTCGENILCQRYFKLFGPFREASLRSFDLAYTLRECATMIDNDLKEKSNIYLKYMAPKIFDNEEAMKEYFKDEKHCKEMVKGEGIILRKPSTVQYVWTPNGPKVSKEIFDIYYEWATPLDEDVDVKTYKLSFLDNGREVCSTIWEGIYPRFVRNSIDLMNNRRNLEESNPFAVGLKEYLYYRMSEGKQDLAWAIIKKLSAVCSYENPSDYTTFEDFTNEDGSVTHYKNPNFYADIRTELNKNNE